MQKMKLLSMKTAGRTVLTVFGLTAFLLGYGGSEAKQVHNGEQGVWGKTPAVTLAFTRTLGEIDGYDDNLLFHRPADVAFDSAGNLYVLDAGNRRIQKLSPEGTYLATIGREGQGPGEFQHPVSIDIDGKGNIVVPDAMNRRIEIFSPDGTPLKSIPMNSYSIGPVLLDAQERMLMGKGRVATFSIGGGPEDNALPKYMKIFDKEGNVLREFGDQFDFEDTMINSVGNRYDFSLDDEGNIYVAFDHQNRIEKFDASGNLLWRADRELGYSMKPPKAKSQTKVSGNTVSISLPPMSVCSNGIAVDGKGRIWVVGYSRQLKDSERLRPSNSDSGEKQEEDIDPNNLNIFHLEVYDSEGQLLGQLPVGHYVDGIRINGDKMYLLDRDRQAVFFEYTIVEKSAA